MNEVSGRRSRAGAYSVTNSAEQIATGTAMHERDDRDEERAEQRRPHAELARARAATSSCVKKLNPAALQRGPRPDERGTARSAPSARASGRRCAARDDAVGLVGPRPGAARGGRAPLRAVASPRLCRATSLPTALEFARRARGRVRSARRAFDSVEVAARWPLGERHRNNDRQVRDRTGRAAGRGANNDVAPRRISA